METFFSYKDVLFFTLFSCVATLAITAGLYLLLRRGNAFAPDITPPQRVRRWAASFFLSAGISHLCWLFIHFAPIDFDTFNRLLICTTFDTVTIFPTVMCTMLTMLQDRRRSLWSVAVPTALTLAGLLVIYFHGSKASAIIIPLFVIILIYITIMMAHAVRQYERWLLDNYADMEHKEVWQTFLVMGFFLLTFIAYTLANNYFFFEVLIEIIDILFFICLLWRVETLETLNDHADAPQEAHDHLDPTTSDDPLFNKLEILLQKHCVDEQYYLKHDISLNQLAKHIGTNSTYLSRHFAHQGITYNTYINNLRIRHFKFIYREAIATKRNFTVRQLALESGYRSYSTFGTAFKQIMGQPATTWILENS